MRVHSTIEEFRKKASIYASQGKPFFFLLDFELKRPVICLLEETKQHGISYVMDGKSNVVSSDKSFDPISLAINPISYDCFVPSFNAVQSAMLRGESYLLNLTFASSLKCNLSIKDIFEVAKAPYKLLFLDKFVCFSPERFIKIKNDKIYTYPMKGTIAADYPNAEACLLNNSKEKWEHNTIVDFMRNDLSMVASNVKVERFRYVEKIQTHKGAILQTSSEIIGDLQKDWKENLGDLILKLLPAGSISGAPKKRSLALIKTNEHDERSYYTGIFGCFDGSSLDSAVAIRYIEKRNDGLYFRSGGGITALSHPKEEYDELIQKIYVPTV